LTLEKKILKRIKKVKTCDYFEKIIKFICHFLCSSLVETSGTAVLICTWHNVSGQWDKGDGMHTSWCWWIKRIVLCRVLHSHSLLRLISLCTSQQCPSRETWSPCHHISSRVFTRITHSRAGAVSALCMQSYYCELVGNWNW